MGNETINLGFLRSIILHTIHHASLYQYCTEYTKLHHISSFVLAFCYRFLCSFPVEGILVIMVWPQSYNVQTDSCPCHLIEGEDHREIFLGIRNATRRYQKDARQRTQKSNSFDHGGDGEEVLLPKVQGTDASTKARGYQSAEMKLLGKSLARRNDPVFDPAIRYGCSPHNIVLVVGAIENLSSAVAISLGKGTTTFLGSYEAVLLYRPVGRLQAQYLPVRQNVLDGRIDGQQRDII